EAGGPAKAARLRGVADEEIDGLLERFGLRTPRPDDLLLEDYAAFRKLDLRLLREHGLGTVNRHGQKVVSIPYYGRRGRELLGPRFRIGLRKPVRGPETRFVWRKGTKASRLLYGLWRLDLALEAGYVLVSEGESDCHVAWQAGRPAVGVPG